MPSGLTALASLSLLIWLYLALFHGRYWRADQRLNAPSFDLRSWPAVVVIVPARNEADVIEAAVCSLLSQDYRGEVKVIVVDDRSDDGTSAPASRGATMAGRPGALTVVPGRALPDGWSGKLWAVHQGVLEAGQIAPEADYLLLTDADVVHAQSAIRSLVFKAETERLDLVSLMVMLHCKSLIERLLIPAFVYFFQQLYPFPRANRDGDAVAAAAGGCMLVRRSALARIGGIASIRDALIDDCALARAIKATGPIWIGLAERSKSIRPYEGLADIWNMVARTAYTQLSYSPANLVGTVFGLAIAYLAPPLIFLAGVADGQGQAAAIGLVAWMVMAMTYAPTLRLYRQPLVLAFALPGIAVPYALMTIDSARRHWQGRGGAWKGRTYSGMES
jgi:hopene-associated glycosyltransferase HpnB